MMDLSCPDEFGICRLFVQGTVDQDVEPNLGVRVGRILWSLKGC